MFFICVCQANDGISNISSKLPFGPVTGKPQNLCKTKNRYPNPRSLRNLRFFLPLCYIYVLIIIFQLFSIYVVLVSFFGYSTDLSLMFFLNSTINVTQVSKNLANRVTN